MEIAQEAAAALKFNTTLVRMAQTIINGMKQAGITEHNGAHMRLEKDAVDWATILGGMPKYMAEYTRSFVAAGFRPDKDVYVASGLLSYRANAQMQNVRTLLRLHSKTVQHKEMYLPSTVLKELNPEQQAVIDFLVLSTSTAFVGVGSSTFSVYLR